MTSEQPAWRRIMLVAICLAILAVLTGCGRSEQEARAVRNIWHAAEAARRGADLELTQTAIQASAEALAESGDYEIDTHGAELVLPSLRAQAEQEADDAE